MTLILMIYAAIPGLGQKTPDGTAMTYWTHKGSFDLNINEAVFSKSWRGGSASNISLGSHVHYKVRYKKGPKYFSSELTLDYGKSKNYHQRPKKTNDRILCDNMLSSKLSKHWDLFIALRFDTQFDAGYTTDGRHDNESPVLTSKFMAPAYLTESLGSPIPWNHGPAYVSALCP